jgi:hypothetical protein
MPQQEEGDKRNNARHSSGGQHNEKRGMKDTIQGDWAMAVIGGGDVAGEKRNNQIEATTAVVGTVGAAIDGGEMRANGKMSGWQTMQGDCVAEDAAGGGGGQCRAIGQRRLQREGGGSPRKAIGWRRTQQEGGADDVRQLGGG